MDKLTMGDRIKTARKNRGLTQEALAEKVDVTLYYMGEIERGTKTPSLDLFIRLVEVLDVSADYLLRDTVSIGNVYGDKRMARKLENLTPRQRAAIEALIDTYIEYLN
ncbi:MAG: helix-turn-helix transcriptional regulator [Ruminococcaceae bacterium]|nr:helix-turn-helix transcriptional regulator [Oscillospiraceae bacterium]